MRRPDTAELRLEPAEAGAAFHPARRGARTQQRPSRRPILSMNRGIMGVQVAPISVSLHHLAVQDHAMTPELLAEIPGKLLVISNPPCRAVKEYLQGAADGSGWNSCPDVNPDEGVWRYLKRKVPMRRDAVERLLAARLHLSPHLASPLRCLPFYWRRDGLRLSEVQ